MSQRVDRRRERENEGQRRVKQGHGAVACVPSRGPIVLGVDEKGDATDFARDADAAIGRAQEQRATEAAALETTLDRETAETKSRNVVSRQALVHDSGCAAVFDRRRTERVKTKDASRRADRGSDEALGAAALVVLARVTLEVAIEID